MIKREQRNLVDQLTQRQLKGYVIYSPNKSWWGRWFGRFAHCYVILRQPNQWVEVHHHFSYTNISVYPPGYAWAKEVEGIIQPFNLEFPYTEMRCKQVLALFTCVETVKSLLGIGDWRIVTPYQLYRYLDGQHTKS